MKTFAASAIRVLDRGAMLGMIGGGRRCTVVRARTEDGRDVVLKRFSPHAVAKHARHHPVPLARFEFERNSVLHRQAGLTGCIARPLGFAADGARHILVQEFVQGVKFGTFLRCAGETESYAVAAELARIVEIAHSVSIFDLDLHPANVLVVPRERCAPRVVLFDFNKIPYHLKPPNILARALVACGLIGPRSRDQRCLRAIRRRIARRLGQLAAFYYAQTAMLAGELEPMLAAI